MNRTLAILALAILLAADARSQTTATFRPSADGATEQWTNNAGAACSGATCYTEVSETSGSTNCTASSYVKGSGTPNKAPATSGQVQTYALSLSSIPDGNVITNITVYTCQMRGGSQSTNGTLRIVVGGTPTECGASQAAGTSYAEASCSFTVNISKGGSTSIEIGNKTTQGRAIYMDAIAARLTYQAGASRRGQVIE